MLRYFTEIAYFKKMDFISDFSKETLYNNFYVGLWFNGVLNFKQVAMAINFV